MYLASNFTFVRGIGMDYQYGLLSFDEALRAANIGNYNIVRVSSILPPGAVRQRAIDVVPGSVLYVAYATDTIIGNGRVSSAISVGLPKDMSNIGVIMEYSSSEDKESVIRHSREMVEKAMKKRGIALSDILSVGIEAEQKETKYLTTFAGIALW